MEYCTRTRYSRRNCECEECLLDMIRERHHRAAAYFRENSVPVEIIDDNTYRVKSFTDPESNDDGAPKMYTVTKRETKECEEFFDCTLVCKACKICSHEFYCDCPDYESRNTICKHIHAVGISEAPPEQHCVLYEYNDDDGDHECDDDDEDDMEWDDDDDRESDNEDDRDSYYEDDRQWQSLRWRHRRAVEYLEENPVSGIKNIGYNLYLVPSFTGPEMYTVQKSKKKACEKFGYYCRQVCDSCQICSHEFHCNCPDYQGRRTICKHIHAVQISGYTAAPEPVEIVAPVTPEKPKKLFLYSGNVTHVLDI